MLCLVKGGLVSLPPIVTDNNNNHTNSTTTASNHHHRSDGNNNNNNRLWSYGVQAAWRLRDWNQLDDFLKRSSLTEPDFEFSLGK